MRKKIFTGLNRGRRVSLLLAIVMCSIAILSLFCSYSGIVSGSDRNLMLYQGYSAVIVFIICMFGFVEYIVLTPGEIVLYSMFIPILRMKIHSSVYMKVTYFTTNEPRLLLLSNTPIENEDECEEKKVNFGPFNAFSQLVLGKKTCNSMQLIYDKKYEQAIREFYQIRE